MQKSFKPPEATQPRRLPQQDRSRERVERILQVTVALIAEQGYEAIAMREIARRVGIPISSVYQYFPNKMAIAQHLADHYLQRLGQLMMSVWKTLDWTQTIDPLIGQAVHRTIDAYYQFYRNEPAMQELWRGCQAIRELRDMELAQNEINAATLNKLLQSFRPEQPAEILKPLSRLMVELTGSALRLALALPPDEADQLIQEYKQLLIVRLRSLL